MDNENITSVFKRFQDSDIALSQKTIGKYFSLFRGIIVRFMENFLENVLFNNECEIDEAAITSKRNGPHGRIPPHVIWVFGILVFAHYIWFQIEEK